MCCSAKRSCSVTGAASRCSRSSSTLRSFVGQAHPPGNTEVYVVIDAEPGATIRLGFAVDVDADIWTEKARRRPTRSEAVARAARRGRRRRSCRGCSKSGSRAARREPAELETALCARLADASGWSEVAARLKRCARLYWTVLDSLNAIPVKAGDVIYNANPPRITAASGEPPSAEVHALGNPEGRGVFRARDPAAGSDVARLGQRSVSAAQPRHRRGARGVEPRGDAAGGIHRRADGRTARRSRSRRLRVLSARAPRADAGLAIDAPASAPHSAARRSRAASACGAATAASSGAARARRVGVRPGRRRRVPHRGRGARSRRQSELAAVCRLSR